MGNDQSSAKTEGQVDGRPVSFTLRQDNDTGERELVWQELGMDAPLSCRATIILTWLERTMLEVAYKTGISSPAYPFTPKSQTITPSSTSLPIHPLKSPRHLQSS